MSLIIGAAQFADEVHKDQQRKYSGRPHVSHLIRVAGRVSTIKSPIFVTDHIVAAAWLHDTIEDQPDKVDKKLLQDKFGLYVSVLVDELTNKSKITHAASDRAEQKAVDRASLACVGRVSKVIKLIDRIDNMAEIISDAEVYDAAADFLLLYQHETILLLDESLKGASVELEAELRGLCAR